MCGSLVEMWKVVGPRLGDLGLRCSMLVLMDVRVRRLDESRLVVWTSVWR